MLWQSKGSAKGSSRAGRGTGEQNTEPEGCPGQDPQERVLEALNGDKFHLSHVSSKNFGDFTGCGCPGRMALFPEDIVLPRPHGAPQGCVCTPSIQSTPAWLENLILQAGRG